MNREILFRGKRIDNGEWVEGFYFELYYDGANTPCIGIEPLSANDYGEIFNCCYAMIDPSTVGQYTGLTDKNGARIFEGDIVKTNKYGKDDGQGHNFNGSDMFRVDFEDGGYCLMNKWRRFNLRPADTSVEIVGSIQDGKDGRHDEL